LIGPGKYDHLATHVREASKAEAVIVIVLNGGLEQQSALLVRTWAATNARIDHVETRLDRIERRLNLVDA
jgi:hypothetical protein